MKKRFLKFYDKVVIAAIMSLFALVGCCRKTYSEKKIEKSEQAMDTVQFDKKAMDREVIAMYGVRSTKKLQ